MTLMPWSQIDIRKINVKITKNVTIRKNQLYFISKSFGKLSKQKKKYIVFFFLNIYLVLKKTWTQQSLPNLYIYFTFTYKYSIQKVKSIYLSNSFFYLFFCFFITSILLQITLFGQNSIYNLSVLIRHHNHHIIANYYNHCKNKQKQTKPTYYLSCLLLYNIYHFISHNKTKKRQTTIIPLYF